MIAALLAALLAASAPAQTLKLRDGTDLHAAVRSYDGKTVALEDGRSLPAASVLEIGFAQGGAGTAAAAPGSALAARGRELFAQAKRAAERFPGSDGLVLLDEGEFRLRPDGTWVERYRFAGQPLTDEVKSDWGEAEMGYEDGRERAAIVSATVYHADGSAFPLDASKIKASEPQSGAQFFEERRQLSYALPRVEKGAIVEWTVERETYNPFRKDFFFPRWGFRRGQPVALSRFTITVPEGRRLYWSARHFPAKGKPTVTTRDGATSYVWELRDLPAIPREPRAVPYGDYAPEVKAALFKSWAPIYDWLRAMHEQRAQAGPELAAVARKVTAGATTEDGKIAALYDYVQKEVRYVAVQISVAAGWGGHEADETWKRRYGCCIDKAVLFAAMLKSVGIRAEPVLLDTNESARHDFNVPDIYFEHAITRIRSGGRDFLLDATGEDYRYPSYAEMDHGVSVLDPETRQIVPFGLPRPEDDSEESDYDIALSSGGDAQVAAQFHYTGAREAEIRGWFKSQKTADQQRMFQDWVAELSPAGRLRDFQVRGIDDLTQPARFSMRYFLPDYAIRASNLSIVNLPDWERGFDEVALDKRELGLSYSSSSQVARRYALRLADGLSVASLPATKSLRGPRESYRQSCRQDGRVVRCESVLRRWARVYEPSEYAAHKRFLEQVARLTKDTLFLEREGPK